MNLAHLHLLINHLPVFGSILGALVLIYGLWKKSIHTQIAAYLVFIISSIGVVITYYTGEDAEEAVEHIAGISKSLIHEHEEAGEFALIFCIVLGVIALVGLFLSLRKQGLARIAAVITLLVALFSFSVFARTGYLGGLIRHPEVHSPGINNGSESED